MSPSVPDVDDFVGVFEEFVASFESVGFLSK